MLSWKKISILCLAAFLIGGLFSVAGLVKAPARVLDPVVRSVEERFGARLSFHEPRLVFLPAPGLAVKNLSLEPVTAEFPAFRAEEVDFSFRLFSFLLGRAEISGFRLRGGEMAPLGVPLRKIELKVRNLLPRHRATFEGKAGAPQSGEIMKVKGGLVFEGWNEKFWTGLSLKADIAVNHLSLEGKNTAAFLNQVPGVRLSGELNGKLHLEKEKNKEILSGLTDFEIKNFQWGDSLPFPLAGEWALFWNTASDSLEIKRGVLRAPFAEVEGRGTMNLQTGEIGEVRFTGRKTVLMECVKHFPSTQSLLPVDMGFSGESGFDLMLQGTLDYLTVHVNLDLTPAVLTYGKIFSKPKDFPLEVNGDLLLKAGSVLSGDVSFRIQQTTVKGSLVDVDLKSGMGELTLLTNKFDLAGWETLLAPLRDYKLSGSAKLLTHWKGNLGRLAEAEKTVNLTLDEASFLSSQGLGVRQAGLFLDASGLSLKVKESRMVFGNSPVQINAELFNLHDNPSGSLNVLSEGLEPHAFLENLKAVEPLWTMGGFLPGLPQRTEEFVRHLLPPGVPLKEWVLSVKTGPEKLVLEELSFQALGGSVRLHGESQWPAEKPVFWFEIETSRVGLARYGSGGGTGRKALEGNLFLNGRFKGRGFKPEEVAEHLSGQGTFSVTNGEWEALDLIGALSALAPLRGVAFPKSPPTPFNDLKGTWNYSGGKYEVPEFLLYSRDLWVEGKGHLSQELALNARLEVYLSRDLTQRVLKAWKTEGKSEGKQLGPFPFLLLGKLSRPEVRPDERRMESFLEDLEARRFRRILAKPFSGRG